MIMLDPSVKVDKLAPRSYVVPLTFVAHAHVPSAFNFATKASVLPALKVVDPNVAEPLKYPVMMLEPSARTETLLP